MINFKKYFSIVAPIAALIGIVFFIFFNNNNENVIDDENIGYISNQIIYILHADPPELDPTFQNNPMLGRIAIQVWEGLTRIDENRDVVPNLAESYYMLDDGSWVFNLRQGIFFHDGAYFNADAVAGSIRRIISPQFSFLDMITYVQVVDDYTVHITTREPFAALPSHFAHFSTFILSPLAIEAEQLGTPIHYNIAGTGPFRFDSRIHGEYIDLIRNESYWGGIPYVEKLRFVVIPDPAHRVRMIENRQANAVLVQPSDMYNIHFFPHIEATIKNSDTINFIGFNTARPPFDDVRLRRAIAMIIDRDDILTVATEGIGIPATIPIPFGSFGHTQNIEPLPHDPNIATDLIEQAGLSQGFTTAIHAFGEVSSNVIIAQYLQDVLLKLNIEADIYLHDIGPFLNLVTSGQYEGIIIANWTSPTWDADFILNRLFHSNSHGAPGNWTRYTNSYIDQLLNQARQERDPEKRIAIYQNISMIIIEEAPLITTHYLVYPFLTTGVTGIEMNNGTLPEFRNARVG